MSQHTEPGSHAGRQLGAVHVPALHIDIGVVHEFAQTPQCSGSFWRFTHEPLQHVRPPAQVPAVHRPPPLSPTSASVVASIVASDAMASPQAPSYIHGARGPAQVSMKVPPKHPHNVRAGRVHVSMGVAHVPIAPHPSVANTQISPVAHSTSA